MTVITAGRSPYKRSTIQPSEFILKVPLRTNTIKLPIPLGTVLLLALLLVAIQIVASHIHTDDNPVLCFICGYGGKESDFLPRINYRFLVRLTIVATTATVYGAIGELATYKPLIRTPPQSLLVEYTKYST